MKYAPVFSAALTLSLLSAAPVLAQWQVPLNTIPVGRGAGVTGFGTVGGSGGAGAKCLLDTVPPAFGTCPSTPGTVTPGVVYVTQAPYNAVCNGVADDTVPIQNAVNSGAAIVVIPAGVCGIGSAGIIGASNQTLTGQGRNISSLKLLVNPASDFVTYPGRTNFVVQDLTIDWNNKVPITSNGALTVNGGNFTLQRLRVINIATFGIIVTNASDNWYVQDNYILKTTPSTSSNQAILLTSVGGANANGFIQRNRLQGSGMDVSCKFCMLLNNRVSGWAYGAGITIEAEPITSQNVIAGNILTDGGTAVDSNGYRPGGVENWGSFSAITGNISNNNGGAGYDQGGFSTAVSGNVATLNGAGGTAGVGISARFQSSTYNQANSTYVGNVARDAGNGTQAYGMAVDANNPQYINSYANSFQGATAPVTLGSGSYRSFVGPALEGFVGVGANTIATGGTATATVAVVGAAFGDRVAASLAADLQGCTVSGYVSAANTVIVVLTNNTGSSKTLASAIVNVTVYKGVSAANY